VRLGERIDRRGFDAGESAWTLKHACAIPAIIKFKMWDVLRWHDGTLSVAWWALVALAILVMIAAGRPGRS